MTPKTRFIESSADPMQGMTDAERRTLAEAFDCRNGLDFNLRNGISTRGVVRALPIVKRLRRMRRLPLPEPPQPADWRVWQHRQGANGRRRSYDALAGDDSPVLRELRRTRRSTPESRHQLALRAVRRVERFRRACDERGCSWWFRAIERTVTD